MLATLILCLGLAVPNIHGAAAASVAFRRTQRNSGEFNAKVLKLRNTLKASKEYIAKGPAGKVEHLVADVTASIRKADDDATRTFSSLELYDQKFESGLSHEIATLKRTLKKLASMQAMYSASHNASRVKLMRLNATEHNQEQLATHYVEGTKNTSDKFDSLLHSVSALTSLLKTAAITDQGTLVTPEAPDANGQPSRVYSAIRRLLAANMPLKGEYPDVYSSFGVPEAGLLQLRGRGQTVAPPSKVHMTPALVKRTIQVLNKIEGRLTSMKSEALLQFDVQHQHFESEAASAGVTVKAQQGVEAENEQKSEELDFSIRFSKAVLKLDQQFKAKLQQHTKSLKDSMKGIQESRQSQLSILRDLSGVLEDSLGKAYNPASMSEEDEIPEFVQVSSMSLSPVQMVSNLQTEIESTISKKGNTHAILLRIKAALENHINPVEAPKVQTILTEMENSLRSMEDDRVKMNEAKRGCESQIFHAKQEEQSLKANVALMSTAFNHAKAAIRASKANINDISRKSNALDASLEDAGHLVSHSLKVSKSQAHDRNTIVLAIKKAIEVVGSNSAVELMQTLLQELAAEESKDHAYKSQLASLKVAFTRYAEDYKQLLVGRRNHYENSVGALQLHVSELDGDLVAQKETLGTGQELKAQSEALCKTISKFYDNHLAELMDTMRTILLKMPAGFVMPQ